jgi:hypothetical protein
MESKMDRSTLLPKKFDLEIDTVIMMVGNKVNGRGVSRRF